MLYKRIDVPLGERAIVFQDGLPLRELAPGRHRVWGTNLDVLRFWIEALVFEAPPEVRAVLSEGSFAEITLEREQRGVLFRDGRPVRFLEPGTVRYWTIDPSIELRVYDVREPMPEMTEELLTLLPGAAYMRVTVLPYERGLETVGGRLTRVLEPGPYGFWNDPEAVRAILRVDMRRQQLQIAGQELMTRDKVTLRLNLTLEAQVVDPALAYYEAEDARDVLYVAAQLALREYVGASPSTSSSSRGKGSPTRSFPPSRRAPRRWASASIASASKTSSSPAR